MRARTNDSHKIIKLKEISKRVRANSTDACFLLAFSSQINDKTFFRELIKKINSLQGILFDISSVEKLVNGINTLLGSSDFFFEKSNSNTFLIKNNRGMVVKLINSNDVITVDSYYSYPSTSKAGNKKFKIGKTRFYSSYEAVKRLVEYISNCQMPVNKKGKPKERVRHKKYIKIMSFEVNILSSKRTTNRIKRAESRLKLANVITLILCYVFGVVLVQALCLWVFGKPILSYIAFFFCAFFGMILNHIITGLFFPILIRRYKEKLNFGDDGHGGNLFTFSYVSNILIYLASMLFVYLNTMKIVELLLGLLFTFYPMNYLVNLLYSMKRNVLKINSGKTSLNVRYYSNTSLYSQKYDDMLPVTINITVFTEDNEVIFDTMRQAMAAIKEYTRKTGVDANLVISDDGFFRYLAQMTNPYLINEYMKRLSENDPTLSKDEMTILERILFYRKNGIAFVARPNSNRLGKFKKGGNVNYTNRLAAALAKGYEREKILASDSEFYGCYFEGNVIINDIVLILDKDSGVHPGILYATIPEFINDPKLVYTQHKTVSANAKGNYFTKAMSVFLNTLYNTHLPNKALQGLTVPLMGQNAFVRKSFIEESGGWAENRVAEDFSKSLDAYRLGYHGKFIAYSGLEFTEHVCQTYAEEAEKNHRYCYGLMEMVFKDFHKHLSHYLFNKPYDNPAYKKLAFFRMVDIFTYFLSYVNLAASIPTSLFIISGTYIHILYGGILINLLIYYFCPILLSILFAIRNKDRKVRSSPLDHAIINFNYFGHCYSMLKGVFSLVADGIKGAYNPFPSSSVDFIQNRFLNGLKIIFWYYLKNIPYTVSALILAYKGVLLLMSGNTTLNVVVPAIYLISFLFPILLLTPQVFGKQKNKR